MASSFMFSKWLQVNKHEIGHENIKRVVGESRGALPSQDDVLAAGGGDKDVPLLGSFVHRGHFVT